jgi:hypothetical protein
LSFRPYGISSALRETIGVPLTPTQLADMQPHFATARQQLGESAFALESTGRG